MFVVSWNKIYFEKLRIETFSTFEARAGEIDVYEFSACSYLIASEASVVQFMDLQHTTAWKLTLK